MASTPAFGSTPRMASAAVSATADNSWTTFTNAIDLITGVAAGTKIEEIVFQGIGVTVAGVVNVVFYDGTTNHLLDQVLVTALTATSTAIGFRAVRQYPNLVLPNANCKIKISSMVASQLIKATAFGADLT